jgi:hypothetical protein
MLDMKVAPRDLKVALISPGAAVHTIISQTVKDSSI